MADRPLFRLELNLAASTGRTWLEDPAILNDKLINEAWGMVSDFVIDALDELGIEATDEGFRETFLELCYFLIMREMTTLNAMPIWEQNFKERVGTRKRGPRKRKGDS